MRMTRKKRERGKEEKERSAVFVSERCEDDESNKETEKRRECVCV